LVYEEQLEPQDAEEQLEPLLQVWV